MTDELIKCTGCGSRKLPSFFSIKPTTDQRFKTCDTCRSRVRSKDIQCPSCEYKCAQQVHLKQHIKAIHAQIKDFQCPSCEYKCGQQCTLNKHVKFVHDQIRDLQCPSCEFKCARQQHLNEHIKFVHEQIRDLQCPSCEFKCGRQQNLNMHIKAVHDLIKDFQCPYCEHKCTQHHHLNQHIKAVHDQIKDHVCNKCDYSSSRADKLRDHMKTCTGRERMSSGEYTIKGILEAMSIHFIREMRFADCKDSNTLPFDFYLPQHTAVIEYDGLQHFEAVEYFGGQETFEYTQRHDQIKNAYCAANNIRLLRIKYTDFEKVEDLIREFIQSC